MDTQHVAKMHVRIASCMHELAPAQEVLLTKNSKIGSGGACRLAVFLSSSSLRQIVLTDACSARYNHRPELRLCPVHLMLYFDAFHSISLLCL